MAPRTQGAVVARLFGTPIGSRKRCARMPSTTTIQHPFHRRMNDGESSREEIRGWVANRFHYQASIPRKDAAILQQLS